MKLSKGHWISKISLLALSVCLFLPFYIINRQYEQSAANKALIDARFEAGNYPEKPESTLPHKMGVNPLQRIHDYRQDQAIGMFQDKTPSLPNPEIYYRRKVAVGKWVLWLYLLPLLGGLTSRSWVVTGIIFILWMLTWHLAGLRF
jgi:hypothetical protein